MTNRAQIFLVDSTEQLTPMHAADYIKEDQLQRYLERYPDLLAGDQIDPESPRRWLLVAREMGIPAEEDGGNNWSIDHLFIDQDGVPTFVECKRASDTRIRREVVAQMLDYAANGTAYWTMERIRQTATVTASNQGREIDDLVGDLIDGDDEISVERFWQNVEENLKEGHVRLLFVVDEAPRELRRLVEFLNEKMVDVQVLIVELKQYTSTNATALVPRVLGQTQRVSDRKTSKSSYVRGPKLTLQTFLSRCSPQGGEICTQLFEMAEAREFELVWNVSSVSIVAQGQRNDQKVTILYAYATNQPGKEYLEFYIHDFWHESNTAASVASKLVESALFERRRGKTIRSIALETAEPSKVFDLCRIVLDAGHDLASELT